MDRTGEDKAGFSMAWGLGFRFGVLRFEFGWIELEEDKVGLGLWDIWS